MNDILPSVGACVLVNLCVTTPSCLLIFLIKYIKLFSNKTKLKQFVYLKLVRLIIRYGRRPRKTKTFHSPAGDVFPATARPAINLSSLRCHLLHCKVIHKQDFQSWQPAKQTFNYCYVKIKTKSLVKQRVRKLFYEYQKTEISTIHLYQIK